MRRSRLPAGLLIGFLPLLALAGHDSVPPYANRWAGIDVYDRTDHRALPVYVHEDRMYVAGEPGHQYELRLNNRSHERVLAVTSVDGVNVITGQTADSQQSGYVLQPYDSVNIEGWRKSMDEVATFYFTRLSRSYAARTGRPGNVGVIGVAVFREHLPCCRTPATEQLGGAAPAAPLARDEAAHEEDSISSRRTDEKLGTGHGHREPSQAEYVNFQRASNTAEETIVIYYDSRKNLVARGVIRERRQHPEASRPNPFPNESFVPDP